MTLSAVHFSSENPAWCTPENLLAPVRKMGPIVLDPCSNKDSLVRASVEWFGPPGIDGLVEPWRAMGLIFVNPPYGREIVDWVIKCAVEHMENDAEVIALVPARTDTAWWHEGVRGVASAVCFWRGRLKFVGALSSAPFPSAVIYYGRRVEKFRAAFDEVGWVVTP